MCGRDLNALILMLPACPMSCMSMLVKGKSAAGILAMFSWPASVLPTHACCLCECPAPVAAKGQCANIMTRLAVFMQDVDVKYIDPTYLIRVRQPVWTAAAPVALHAGATCGWSCMRQSGAIEISCWHPK